MRRISFGLVNGFGRLGRYAPVTIKPDFTFESYSIPTFYTKEELDKLWKCLVKHRRYLVNV